jgi:hypothetical protein
MKLKFFSMKEVSERLGIVYDRVWYAAITGKVKPLTVGRARLFTESDIEQLRHYFDKMERDGRSHPVRKTGGEKRTG